MKGYGLPALAPLATVYPSPPSGGTGETGASRRGTKAIATANLQIELPEVDPKNLPEWAEEFSEFLLLTAEQHPNAGLNARSSKGCGKLNTFSDRLRPPSGRAPTGATS